MITNEKTAIAMPDVPPGGRYIIQFVNPNLGETPREVTLETVNQLKQYQTSLCAFELRYFYEFTNELRQTIRVELNKDSLDHAFDRHEQSYLTRLSRNRPIV